MAGPGVTPAPTQPAGQKLSITPAASAQPGGVVQPQNSSRLIIAAVSLLVAVVSGSRGLAGGIGPYILSYCITLACAAAMAVAPGIPSDRIYKFLTVKAERVHIKERRTAMGFGIVWVTFLVTFGLTGPAGLLTLLGLSGACAALFRR